MGEKLGIGELPAREVDGDRDGRRVGAEPLPDRGLRQACSITQRPIGTIRRDSSATGMKASGPIRPRSGWFQRSSASIATMEPSRSLITGW